MNESLFLFVVGFEKMGARETGSLLNFFSLFSFFLLFFFFLVGAVPSAYGGPRLGIKLEL